MPDIILDRVCLSTTSGIVPDPHLTQELLEPSIMEYGVVDLFAGPGGLAEGFAEASDETGRQPFSIALSIEKEPSANRTLTLRNFLRTCPDARPAYIDALNGGCTDPTELLSLQFPDAWKRAVNKTPLHELSDDTRTRTSQLIAAVRETWGENTIVIGGPPCQAYSLVGRARNRGVAGYSAEGDIKHRLYEQYVQILRELNPAVFVMENVRGLLSSQLNGERVFDRILRDLEALDDHGQGYEIVTLGEGTTRTLNGFDRLAREYLVRMEDHGVPQARHRVILVGLRKDIADRLLPHQRHAGLLERAQSRATVNDMLSGMPRLRSAISRDAVVDEPWHVTMRNLVSRVEFALQSHDDTLVRDKVNELKRMVTEKSLPIDRRSADRGTLSTRCGSELRTWVWGDGRLQVLLNHETRPHTRGDLARYFFAAAYTSVHGRSPKADQFPDALAPAHRNWNSGKFADRFRVQWQGAPSTTVTSHLSRDGHYFIHPDPLQCRSLTVREAARLQTFPDDYLFLGPRTQQFVQVGNAVPPFLARQIACALIPLLA